MTLPRKLYQSYEWNFRALFAKVHSLCVAIWQSGRSAGRNDTFIGLINTKNMLFFLAPCFGVEEGMTRIETAKEKETARDLGEAYVITEKVARGQFSGREGFIVSSSTSAQSAVVEMWTKSEIERVYGPGNVCYVQLKAGETFQHAKFDGQSHKALYSFLKAHTFIKPDPEGWWNQALGFAIQRDADGYYIRYASTLNERIGQYQGDTFEPRKTARPDREPRDLPGQWARFCERILFRDLKLSLSNAPGQFERMVSRDEHQRTKLSRFTPNRDGHLDAASPGTIGTENRLI
jgi:hypothetical protein